MAKSNRLKPLVTIADDDEDLVFLLTAQLRQAGYKVHNCIGGINLLKSLTIEKPAVLLLDISMLTMNGSELCREIKADPALKDIKIILMSGNHDIASHAHNCGADDYIPKPLSLSQVKLVVSRQAGKA